MIPLLEKLEEYRLENKISQEEIAEKLGVSFNTVNRWLNGKNIPRKMHLYNIQKMVRIEQ